MTKSTFIFHRREWVIFALLTIGLLVARQKTAGESAKQMKRKKNPAEYTQYRLRDIDPVGYRHKSDDPHTDGNLFANEDNVYRMQNELLKDYCTPTAKALCWQKLSIFSAPCGFSNSAPHDPAFSSFMHPFLTDPSNCRFTFWIDEKLPQDKYEHEKEHRNDALRHFVRNMIEELYLFSREYKWITEENAKDNGKPIFHMKQTNDIQHLFRLVVQSVEEYLSNKDTMTIHTSHDPHQMIIRLHSKQYDDTDANPINTAEVQMSGRHLWLYTEVWDLVAEVIREYQSCAASSASESGDEVETNRIINDCLATDSKLLDSFQSNPHEYDHAFRNDFIYLLDFAAKHRHEDEYGHRHHSGREHTKLEHDYPTIAEVHMVSNCLWGYYEEEKIVDPMCGVAMEHAAIRIEQLAVASHEETYEKEKRKYHAAHDWYCQWSIAFCVVCNILILSVHLNEWAKDRGFFSVSSSALNSAGGGGPKLPAMVTLQVRRLLLLHIIVTIAGWCAFYIHYSESEDTNWPEYSVMSDRVPTHIYINTCLWSAMTLVASYLLALSTDLRENNSASTRRPSFMFGQPAALGYELAVMEADPES